MKNFPLLKTDRIIQIVQQYLVEMTSLHSTESIWKTPVQCSLAKLEILQLRGEILKFSESKFFRKVP